jgi:hypothetical protein
VANVRYPRFGIVIGHYNQPDALRLNVTAIRHFCGMCPILVSDDCSDGFGATPEPWTPFGRVLEIQEQFPGVSVWPNVDRIGHSGGDMAATWKGIVWGGNLGLDVVFKLSQRFIFRRTDWAREAAALLMNSDATTLGRGCSTHGWFLRTEAFGMKISDWFRGDILSHLTPRRTGTACEVVVADDILDRLGGRMLEWEWLSPGRGIPSEWYLFREANSSEEYRQLADQLGVELDTPVPTRDSNQMNDYCIG